MSRVNSNRNLLRSVRAARRTLIFVLKVLPMLPSRPLNLITPAPVIEKLEYPTTTGTAVGEIYRPSSRGRHPGIVVCLGVVPFGVDHPQVPRLGEALSRAGFAALLYWSPAMRDFRLDPVDIENIALAYERLLEVPYVDPNRSGFFGTCVGGSFALMAAADRRVRDRVSFVGAFAPYGSLVSLARDVASASRIGGGKRVPWEVDQLTLKVFVHSITALLNSAEAGAIRDKFDAGETPDDSAMSSDAQAICALLRARSLAEAEAALRALPEDVHDGLEALSPVNYVKELKAPLIAISHDRDDTVIPVGESRLLRSTLEGRSGVRYTEFEMFQHADPTKRNLTPPQLVRQLSRFYLWLHAVFREAVR